MCSVKAYLKMGDFFSTQLERIINRGESAILTMTRLQQIAARRVITNIKVKLDDSRAMRLAREFKEKISREIGASSVVAGIAGAGKIPSPADMRVPVAPKTRGPADMGAAVAPKIRGAADKLNNSAEKPKKTSEKCCSEEKAEDSNDNKQDPSKKWTAIADTASKLFGTLVTVATSAINGAAEQQTVRANLQAQLALDTTQAEAALEGVKAVYQAGWGESLPGVGADFATVKQNIQGLSDDAASAYLKSAYAVERISNGKTSIGELSRVTRAMMANFDGLDQTRALDLIATGFQRGGNYANDLMGTINQYGAHFAGMGMSAEQMFATLIAGSEHGAWSLDKVGGAVKESFSRMQDQKSSSAAFAALGLDAQQMAAQIAAGGDAANQAYQATLLALGQVDNAQKRNQIGAELFGAQWKDIGESVVIAMQEGQKGLEGFEGAATRAGEAVETTFAFQMEQLKRNFNTVLAESGQGALDALIPLLTSLNDAFQSGKFQPFFDSFSSGLANAAQLIMFLGEQALWLADVIMSNWSWIGPIIWGVVAAVGALTTAINIAKIAQAAFNLVMNMNPFVLIASLIIGVIVALVYLWKTNDTFVSAMIDEWNAMLNFFDQVPIFFKTIANAIADAFDAAKVTALSILQSLVNGVIDAINWTINELINKIPGISLKPLQHINIIGNAAAEAEAAKQERANELAAMKADKAENAAERERKKEEYMQSRVDNRALEEAEKAAKETPPVLPEEEFIPPTFDGSKYAVGYGANRPNIEGNSCGCGATSPNIDRMDKIGGAGTSDTVDMASEDLKMLRELAEMKNIQNFVTLTPQLSFGDTYIRQEGRSIEEIQADLAVALESELEITASSVLK